MFWHILKRFCRFLHVFRCFKNCCLCDFLGAWTTQTKINTFVLQQWNANKDAFVGKLDDNGILVGANDKANREAFVKQCKDFYCEVGKEFVDELMVLLVQDHTARIKRWTDTFGRRFGKVITGTTSEEEDGSDNGSGKKRGKKG